MIPNYYIKYVKHVFVTELRGFFLVSVSVNFDRRAQPGDDDDKSYAEQYRSQNFKRTPKHSISGRTPNISQSSKILNLFMPN